MSGALGITNPFATVQFEPWKIDEAISKMQYNKLLGEDLRSQIEERAANRTALGNLDFGGPAGGTAAAPAATGGGTAPAPPRTAYGEGGPGASLTVPQAYMPYYEAASKKYGIPVDVLIAQHRQESGFNAAARGKAGEIGLGQVMPSTARQPGFGMAGVDPETLWNPEANIDFSAAYLAARGGKGVDWSNPAQVATALHAYNAGGDPNYVANVTRYLPAARGQQQAAPVQVAGPGAGTAPAGGPGTTHPAANPAVGAAARQLLNLPEDQAAAAYPKVMEDLKTAGITLPNAPATYPGHAAVQQWLDGAGTAGAPAPPPKDPATMTDQEWLDWQAQSYPGMAGPNANPTTPALNAPSAAAPTPGQQAAVTAPAVPGAPAPAPGQPAAVAAPQPAPAAPRPPPPVNNLGLTNEDQSTLRTMATSKGVTVAQVSAKVAELRAHNQALAAQYQNEQQQYEQTQYQRGRDVKADVRADEAHRLQLEADKRAQHTQDLTDQQAAIPALTALAPKILDGTATPAERLQYSGLMTLHFTKPRTDWLPDPENPGKMIPTTVPGEVPPGFPAPDYKPGDPLVKPQPSKPAQLSPAQAKLATFTDRIAGAEPIINQFDQEALSWSETTKAKAGDFIGYTINSPGYQQYRQAQENWLTAYLRDQSGALIGSDEFIRDRKIFFPQPGDSPELVRQKRDARASVVKGMARASGPAYTLPDTPGAGGGGGPGAPPAVIKSDEDYKALPSGATFYDPKGQLRTKP